MPDLHVGKKMIKNRIAVEEEKRGHDPTDDIPKTAVLSFRGDIRDLATLARIFDLEGIIYNSKSSLVAVGLHITAETLANTFQKEYDFPLLFTSTTEAEWYLKEEARIPITNLRSGGRNNVTTLIQKVEETQMGKLEKEVVIPEDVEKRRDEILKESNKGE